MRSLATFSFLAMIFFRLSTLMCGSTLTPKLPPVVVLMFRLMVIGVAALVVAAVVVAFAVVGVAKRCKALLLLHPPLPLPPALLALLLLPHPAALPAEDAADAAVAADASFWPSAVAEFVAADLSMSGDSFFFLCFFF